MLLGDVVAGGENSDVIVTADESIDLHGSLTAGRSIVVSAGTTAVAGTESIRTYGTSSIKSTHGGEIRITGVNDVVINSAIGPDSVDLSLIQLESTSGKLVIAKESGRIETGSQLNFTGHGLEVAGVVKSTRSTLDPDDYEVRIEITGSADLNGDMQLAGALLLKAGSLEIYNQTIVQRTPGQKYRLESNGSITLGRTFDLSDGQKQQQGVVIGAPIIEIIAGGMLTINPGSILFATDAGHVLNIRAGSAVIAGTLYAGADLDDSGLPVWVAPGAASIAVDGNLTFGGMGVDDSGQAVPRGGNVWAVNEIEIAAGGAISQSPLSAFNADATAWGARSASIPSQLNITAGGDMQLFGLAQTLDIDSDIQLSAGGQVLINGLVTSTGDLAITAGTDPSGYGIILLPVELDPVTDQRISGGEIRNGLNGLLTLHATDGILLQGLVGSARTEGASTLADALSITVTSSAGPVTIENRVIAQQSITVHGTGLSVLAGGQLKTTAADATIRLTGSAAVFLESAVDTGPEILAAGQVQSSGLIHLSGSSVTVDGILQSQTARVLLNAVTNVDITGQVTAAADLLIHSGVGAAWSLAKLEDGPVSRSELSGGDVLIADAGSVRSGGAIRVLAGGNLDVQSDATLGGGLTTRTRPIVSTVPQTVYLITGYNQIATGTILVPEIRIVSTNVTRQAGMDEFRIGSVYYTMDVTLTQDGYYNPRAAVGKKQREYFIEGVDYYNATDYPHTMKLGLPVIDWTAYGAPAVTSDYKSSEYRSFAQLTDVQRNAVIRTLGYLPLHNFSYSNARQKQTIEGNPTDQPWVPDWDGKPSVIEYVQVAGWTDKYIRMPQGAAADVQRVVSQGSPEVGSEKVGTYRDR
ncbi:MAG TPA: hypothetical protein DIT89_03885, partial [Planctomycetaceae bacterium]|nr:hypothetical protein [Planctomycetaceae bacterium]